MSAPQNPFNKPQPPVQGSATPPGAQNPFSGQAPMGNYPPANMGNSGQNPQNPFANPNAGAPANPYAAPQQPAQAGMYTTPQSQGDATGGVIPYKNVPALLAYYTGVFSLIPCLGMFLGIVAVILGFVGLSVYKRNPQAHGAVHAWVGIIVGGLSFLAHIAFIVMGIIGANARF